MPALVSQISIEKISQKEAVRSNQASIFLSLMTSCPLLSRSFFLNRFTKLTFPNWIALETLSRPSQWDFIKFSSREFSHVFGYIKFLARIQSTVSVLCQLAWSLFPSFSSHGTPAKWNNVQDNRATGQPERLTIHPKPRAKPDSRASYCHVAINISKNMVWRRHTVF